MIQQRWLLLSLIMWVFFLHSGCSHKKIREEDRSSSGVAPVSTDSDKEIYGPPISVTGAEADKSFGPQPLPGPPLPPGGFDIQKGYVLVFGPGLAKAAATIGVLKEFEQHKLKISALICTELSAFYCAVYASRGLNALEWVITKVNEKILFDFALLDFKNSVAKGESFLKLIKSTLRGAQLENARVPVFIPLFDTSKGQIEYVHSGSAEAASRDAVTLGGLIGRRDNSVYESAAQSEPWSIDFAKSLGLGNVVAFDFIRDNANVQNRSNLLDRVQEFFRNIKSTLPENPGLRDVESCRVESRFAHYLDFDSRAELVIKGRQAVRAWQQGECIK